MLHLLAEMLHFGDFVFYHEAKQGLEQVYSMGQETGIAEIEW